MYFSPQIKLLGEDINGVSCWYNALKFFNKAMRGVQSQSIKTSKGRCSHQMQRINTVNYGLIGIRPRQSPRLKAGSELYLISFVWIIVMLIVEYFSRSYRICGIE